MVTWCRKKNYSFGLREVDKSKINVINFKRTDVDENHGGVIHGVNDCDFYRMIIISSIT